MTDNESASPTSGLAGFWSARPLNRAMLILTSLFATLSFALALALAAAIVLVGCASPGAPRPSALTAAGRRPHPSSASAFAAQMKSFSDRPPTSWVDQRTTQRS